MWFPSRNIVPQVTVARGSPCCKLIGRSSRSGESLVLIVWTRHARVICKHRALRATSLLLTSKPAPPAKPRGRKAEAATDIKGGVKHDTFVRIRVLVFATPRSPFLEEACYWLSRQKESNSSCVVSEKSHQVARLCLGLIELSAWGLVIPCIHCKAVW